MQTFSSAKVQANFGQAMDIAKSGEPVTITQYGRPAPMLFSHKAGEELLRLKSTVKLSNYPEGRAKTMPRDVPELTANDINSLVHELRP